MFNSLKKRTKFKTKKSRVRITAIRGLKPLCFRLLLERVYAFYVLTLKQTNDIHAYNKKSITFAPKEPRDEIRWCQICGETDKNNAEEWANWHWMKFLSFFSSNSHPIRITRTPNKCFSRTNSNLLIDFKCLF